MTLDETIELANDLMDQKLHTYAERQSNNKRKADESFRNNHGHQQQTLKRQNVTKVYNMGTSEKKPYSGNLPKNNGANPKGNGCFKCGATWHFKRDCIKLKNKDGEKVKFATCTLLDAALTWWNSQIRSLGPDAYSMTWEVLKKKMTDKYCPHSKIKKLFVADETKKIDKNFTPMQKGSQTTKERLMSHLEITMVTNNRVNARVTELFELYEHDTQDLYALLEDAQDSRTRISQRVDVDSQRTEIAELRETDRRRQAHMAETLQVMEDMRREIGDMQAKLLALRGQPRRARQPGGDARVLNHQDALRDADSHI
nr:hypothetical protein [Tanacetum cinerariifolium]